MYRGLMLVPASTLIAISISGGGLWGSSGGGGVAGSAEIGRGV